MDTSDSWRLAVECSDMSKRESAKLQQTPNEEQRVLEAIIDSTTSGVWDWDLVTNAEYLSPRFKEMFGYADHEMENTPEAWQQIIFEEDLPIALNNFEKHVQTKGIHPFSQVVRYRHKKGHIVWVLCTGKVISWSAEGKPLRMVGCHVDVTERHTFNQEFLQTKNFLERTNEVARVGGWQVDLINKKITWSDMTRQIHEVPKGYTPTLEQGIDFYKEGSNRDRIAEAFNAAVERGTPFDEELQIITAHGRTIWVRTAGDPAFENGRCVSISGSLQDITKRKQQEDILRRQSGLITSLLDSIPDLIFFKDMNGVYMGCNPAFAKFVGRKREDIIGKTDYDLFDKEIADTFRYYDAEMIKQNTARQNEEEVTYPDGSMANLATLKTPYLDTDGKTIGTLGISRDISERKQAEFFLRESKEKLEAENNAKTQQQAILSTALATGKMGVWSFDVEAQMFHFTEEFYQVFKTTTEAEGGAVMSAKEYADRFVPKGIHPILEHAIGTALQSKEPSYRTELEHAVIFADGTDGFIRVSMRVLKDEKGRPNQIIGVNQDITESKSIELEKEALTKRLNYALDASGDGIWDWTPLNGITFFSKAWVEMLGYEVGELASMASEWSDRLHPDDAEWVFAAINTVIQTPENGDTFSHEYRFRNKAGEYLWIFNRAKVVERNEKGEATRVVGTHTNITDRKKIEEEKKEAEEAHKIARVDAEKANKAKTSFLATMSHEIRTPMNAVIGMSSLMLNTELSLEQREFAKTIRTSGDALLTIINDILDFSKIESNKITLEEVPFDLSDSILEPIDIITNKARGRNIQLTYEVDASAPSALVGDVARIKQILLNLLSNAVKFSEEGSDVALSVSSRSLPDGGCELTCAIRDNGIGISVEAGKQLFTCFTQADSSINRRYGGTGLGLVISKRLAELMGGELSFESQEGVGSTFYLKLPLRLGTSNKKIFERPDTQTLEGKKLLIIDQNEVNLRLFKAATETWGMSVMLAQNVSEALEKVAQSQPDLILTAWQMSDQSGKDLAERIRIKTPAGSIPILLCLSDPAEKADLPEDLFASILLKPLSPSGLYDALVAAFDLGNKPSRSTTVTRTAKEIDDTLAHNYPLKILIAEDNKVNQLVMTTLLGKMGYLADVAGNGSEAIEALKRQAYDLVLMNIQMPHMNGLDATKHIRFTFPASRQPNIAALTANAALEQKNACLDMGMQAYLTKPIKVKELTELIKETSRVRSTLKGTQA